MEEEEYTLIIHSIWDMVEQVIDVYQTLNTKFKIEPLCTYALCFVNNKPVCYCAFILLDTSNVLILDYYHVMDVQSMVWMLKQLIKQIREKFKGSNVFMEYYEKQVELITLLKSTYYSTPFGRNPLVSDDLYHISFQKNSGTKAFGFIENKPEIFPARIKCISSTINNDQIQDKAISSPHATSMMSDAKVSIRNRQISRKETANDNNSNSEISSPHATSIISDAKVSIRKRQTTRKETANDNNSNSDNDSKTKDVNLNDLLGSSRKRGRPPSKKYTEPKNRNLS